MVGFRAAKQQQQVVAQVVSNAVEGAKQIGAQAAPSGGRGKIVDMHA